MATIENENLNQLKYTYQLQQGDKTHHTKLTTTHRKVTLMLNHPSLQNKTTDVVIHQHSRKLLKMDILMSETCWADNNKWNKIGSDIKLVFHSSTITSVGTNVWQIGQPPMIAAVGFTWNKLDIFFPAATEKGQKSRGYVRNREFGLGE